MAGRRGLGVRQQQVKTFGAGAVVDAVQDHAVRQDGRDAEHDDAFDAGRQFDAHAQAQGDGFVLAGPRAVEQHAIARYILDFKALLAAPDDGMAARQAARQAIVVLAIGTEMAEQHIGFRVHQLEAAQHAFFQREQADLALFARFRRRIDEAGGLARVRMAVAGGGQVDFDQLLVPGDGGKTHVDLALRRR